MIHREDFDLLFRVNLGAERLRWFDLAHLGLNVTVLDVEDINILLRDNTLSSEITDMSGTTVTVKYRHHVNTGEVSLHQDSTILSYLEKVKKSIDRQRDVAIYGQDTVEYLESTGRPIK